jgi:hypothetical protein
VATVRAVRALHMWQMDSYIVPRYLEWLFAKPLDRYVDFIGLLTCAAAGALPPFFRLGADFRRLYFSLPQAGHGRRLRSRLTTRLARNGRC